MEQVTGRLEEELFHVPLMEKPIRALSIYIHTNLTLTLMHVCVLMTHILI